ncbi:MAG: caspase family protein [Parachlamydiaceae bacterium]
MRIFLYFRCLLCVFLCGGLQELSAANFHVILVGDFSSPDISQASAVDLENVQAEVTKIAKICGYTLRLKIIAEKNPIAQKVVEEIKGLAPKKKDIVFFYFSGHGYRTKKHGDSPWPNIDLPKENHGISLKGIIDAISEKKAKLSIILADCCNWKIPDTFAPPVMMKARTFESPEEKERKNARSLFKKSSGVIAIVSSTQGQAAYCTLKGSFYTRSFLQSLQHVMGNEKYVKWDMIFNETSKILKPMLDAHQLRQSPIVYMKLKQDVKM